MAQNVTTLGNTYGNVRQLLGDVGIKSSNAADYNTKFGITLKKRDVMPISKGPSNLLASDEPITLDNLDVQTLAQDYKSILTSMQEK